MNNNSFHLIIYVYWGSFICLFILLFVQTSAEGSCRFFPTSFVVFIHHWRWVSWRIRALKKRRKVRMTISMPYWTRCCCPMLKNGRDKEHSLLEVLQIFLRRLEKQLGLNFSLRASSLWARDSTRIQLKEPGITLALWGALGVGDSTRDSTKGIWNPSSSLRCSGGGRQHPGFC